MRWPVLAVVLAALVAVSVVATADPTCDPSIPVDLCGEPAEEPKPAAKDDPLAETQAEVLDAGEKKKGLLEDLLDSTLGAVGDASGAVADGIGSAFGAVGSGLAALFAALGTAAAWTWMATLTGGSALGRSILWSMSSVGTLMGDALVATGRLVADLFTGLASAVRDAAAFFAAARPDAVHPAAWAGVAATGTAAAAAGANVGLYALLKKFGWALPAVGGFTRIAKEDLLEHPLRNEIFEAIKSNPGIHVSALSRVVDAGWGTTVHHLKKLQDKELIAVRTVNNQKCYFMNGGDIGRNRWVQLSELKNETAGRIAQFILAHPFQTLTDISETLHISPSLVSHHVAKLVKAGVLDKVRDGRFVKLAVTQDARDGLFGERAVVRPVPDMGAVAA